LCLFVDFIAFYFTNAYLTFILTKKLELQLMGDFDKFAPQTSYTRALSLHPAGGLPSPHTPGYVPQPWRQIDAYMSASIVITFHVRRSRGEMHSGHGRLCVCLSIPRRINPVLLHGPADVTWEW